MKNSYLFENIQQNFTATRYHSLVIDQESLPESLIITARTDESENESEIMGIRHKECKLFGVQFHPESILTESGHKLLENFMKAFNKNNDLSNLLFDEDISSISFLSLSKTPSTLVISSSLLDFNDFAIAPAAVSPLILYG